MSLKAYETILSVGFIGIALWFIWEALHLPPPVTKGDVGPQAFPLGIAVLVILFSLFFMIKSLWTKMSTFIEIKRAKFIFILIPFLVLYGLAMPVLGYYLTTAIFLPVMLLLASENSIKTIIFVTIFFELFALFIFDILLGVPLP